MRSVFGALEAEPLPFWAPTAGGAIWLPAFSPAAGLAGLDLSHRLSQGFIYCDAFIGLLLRCHTMHYLNGSQSGKDLPDWQF